MDTDRKPGFRGRPTAPLKYRIDKRFVDEMEHSPHPKSAFYKYPIDGKRTDKKTAFNNAFGDDGVLPSTFEIICDIFAVLLELKETHYLEFTPDGKGPVPPQCENKFAGKLFWVEGKEEHAIIVDKELESNQFAGLRYRLEKFFLEFFNYLTLTGVVALSLVWFGIFNGLAEFFWVVASICFAIFFGLVFAKLYILTSIRIQPNSKIEIGFSRLIEILQLDAGSGDPRPFSKAVRRLERLPGFWGQSLKNIACLVFAFIFVNSVSAICMIFARKIPMTLPNFIALFLGCGVIILGMFLPVGVAYLVTHAMARFVGFLRRDTPRMTIFVLLYGGLWLAVALGCLLLEKQAMGPDSHLDRYGLMLALGYFFLSPIIALTGNNPNGWEALATFLPLASALFPLVAGVAILMRFPISRHFIARLTSNNIDRVFGRIIESYHRASGDFPVAEKRACLFQFFDSLLTPNTFVRTILSYPWFYVRKLIVAVRRFLDGE